MRTLIIVLSVCLVMSVGLNIFFGKQLTDSNNEIEFYKGEVKFWRDVINNSDTVSSVTPQDFVTGAWLIQGGKETKIPVYKVEGKSEEDWEVDVDHPSDEYSIGPNWKIPKLNLRRKHSNPRQGVENSKIKKGPGR